MRVKATIWFSLLLVIFRSAMAQDPAPRGTELLTKTSASPTGKTRAVIVGISEYKNLPPGRQLAFADDDAKLFFNYLALAKYTVESRLFVNHEATATTILLAIDDMISKSANGDGLIFYFAGHGDVARDKTKDQDDAFLLCTNVATDADYSISDAISLSRLQTLIANAAKKGINVSLITDACRSGKVATTEEAALSTAYLLSQKWDKVMKLASCQENELSFEDIKWGNGHGVFTYYLVKGLSKEADDSPRDSLVSLKELELYIKKQVSEATSDVQNPVKVGGDARKIFGKLLPSVFIDERDALPKLATMATSRDANAGITFEDEHLTALYQQFRAYIFSGRSADSAYQVYLNFAAADLSRKYANLLKNQLLLTLAANAQKLIDKYMEGGNDMPAAAEFQKAANDQALAIKLYNSNNVISQQWESKQLFLQAFTYIRGVQREKFSEAASLLKKALKKNKKAAYIYQAFGRMYNEMEEYKASEKYLLKAIALAPRWTYPRSDLGNTYFDMGRWEESKAQLLKALELDNTLARLYNNLARNYLNQGKIAKSERLFIKADSLAPHTSIYQANLGAVYLTQGQTEKGLKKLEEALRLDSNYYWTYQRLGEYYLYESKDNNNAPRALKYLEKAQQLEPYFSKTYNALANYFEQYSTRKENVQQAIDLYNKAITLNPHATSAFYNLAVLLQQRNFDSVLAGQTMDLMLKRNRHSGEAFYYKGLFEIYNKQDKEAEKSLKKSIQLDRYYKDAYTELALLMEKKGRIPEAEQVLLQTLDLFKESPVVTNDLGNFYLRNGNWQQAIDQYHQSLLIDSSYSYAWSSLAFTLLRNTLNVDEVLLAFQKARSLNPYKHNPAEFSSLIRMKADSLNGANAPIEITKQFYEASLSLDESKRPEIQFALAKMYFLSGDCKRAQRNLDQVGTHLSYNLQQSVKNLEWKILLEAGELDKALLLIKEEIEEQEFPSYIGEALYAHLKNDYARAQQFIQKEKTGNPVNLSAPHIENNFSPFLAKIIKALMN